MQRTCFMMLQLYEIGSRSKIGVKTEQKICHGNNSCLYRTIKLLRPKLKRAVDTQPTTDRLLLKFELMETISCLEV